MAVKVGVVCAVGVGPRHGGRANNEDNYLVANDGKVAWRGDDGPHEEPAKGVGTLLAVCDGMGGGDDGEVASASAVRVLARLYRPEVPRDRARALRRYVLESHRRLRDKALESGPVTMGTTLTACWLVDATAAWVQVGDSRLYRFSQDALVRVTADHTRGEFAARDRRTVAEPHGLAQTFIYGSRGLGDDAGLRIEPERDADVFAVHPGDRLLLCSDGLCGSVDDDALAEVLRNTKDPQFAAQACVERAIARGSIDNITVLVADVV